MSEGSGLRDAHLRGNWTRIRCLLDIMQGVAGPERCEIAVPHAVHSPVTVTSHNVAAVVSPRTSSPRRRIAPAPMKPIPDRMPSGRRIMSARTIALRPAMQVSDPLAHAVPGRGGVRFTFRRAERFEVGWIVDRGFDPQHATLLVVHLDRVLPQPVRDPRALGTDQAAAAAGGGGGQRRKGTFIASFPTA